MKKTWASFVRLNQADINEYKRNYYKMYRFKKKTGMDINVAREAAYATVYGQTLIEQTRIALKGFSKKAANEYVKNIYSFFQTSGLAEKYSNIRVAIRDKNNNSVIEQTFNEWRQDFLQKKISVETYDMIIKELKMDPRVIGAGS